MQVHVVARRLKLTSAIRAYVEEKVQKAQKYFNHIVWAQVVLEVEKKAHRAEIVIHAFRQTFRAQARGEDLYAAVDLASDKVDAQLKKYKDRLRGHHRKEPEIESLIAPGPMGATRFSVEKKVGLKPMTREEAVVQMEALGYSFWLFRDKDSKQVQLIYRRVDDTYGILQPVKG